jgi:hypothetical protein
MNPDTPPERWLHVLPLVAIAAFAIALWQPTAETAPSREQELMMDDLAAAFGSRSSSADDIDNRLRAFGRFPPDQAAGRALANALITCGTTTLDERQRKGLARQLFRITVIGDSGAESVPAALMEIQRTVAATGCSPATIDEIVQAASAVARTDPNPRRDWW